MASGVGLHFAAGIGVVDVDQHKAPRRGPAADGIRAAVDLEDLDEFDDACLDVGAARDLHLRAERKDDGVLLAIDPPAASGVGIDLDPIVRIARIADEDRHRLPCRPVAAPDGA